jgi:hypothetical protein
MLTIKFKLIIFFVASLYQNKIRDVQLLVDFLYASKANKSLNINLNKLESDGDASTIIKETNRQHSYSWIIRRVLKKYRV